jgi:medium-chain acyl-[acyl-carrier-protein] hydrolase
MTTMLLNARASNDALAARAASPSSRWIVEVGADRSGRPLLIFPHAGAGPNAYRRLGEAMFGRFRPLIVHLPGRETRLDDSPCHDLPSLVQALARAVAPLVASGSAFYGHSMGALLAFELARQLRRAYGVEPDHLVVSGHAAPRVPRTALRHLLADDALWDSVCAMRGTPAGVAADPGMRALLLPALRADFEICETYRYRAEPALDCPISSFAGAHDEEAPPSQMTGWSAETESAYRQETVPGDHFFNLSDRGFPARLLRTLT